MTFMSRACLNEFFPDVVNFSRGNEALIAWIVRDLGIPDAGIQWWPARLS